MATRDPKQQILPSVRAKVTSRVVDQYFKPQVEPVVSQASKELVQSLGNIIPALRGYNEKRIEDNRIEGSEAQKRLKKSFKDAVRDGDIPEGANPYFIEAYNELEVEDLGNKFSSQFKDVYANNLGELLENPDANALNVLLDENLDKWSVDNNVWGYDSKTVLEKFEPKINALRSQLNAQLSQQRISLIQDKASETIKSNIYTSIEDGLSIVPTDATGASSTLQYSNIGSIINEKLLAMSEVKDQKSLNDLAITTIITYANENLDADALEIAEYISTVNGKSLADIPAYIDLITKAESSILNKIEQAENFKFTQNKRAEDKLLKDTINEFTELFYSSEEPMSPADVDEFLKDKPDFKIKKEIMQHYNSYTDFEIQDNKNVYDDLVTKISLDPYDPNIIADINEAVKDKDITGATAMSLKKEYNQIRNGADSALLLTSDFNELLSDGVELITRADAVFSKDDSAEVERLNKAGGRFRNSFSRRARVIAYDLETNPKYAELSGWEKEIKFEDLLLKEYERQTRLYNSLKLDQNEKKLDQATAEATYPIRTADIMKRGAEVQTDLININNQIIKITTREDGIEDIDGIVYTKEYKEQELKRLNAEKQALIRSQKLIKQESSKLFNNNPELIPTE